MIDPRKVAMMTRGKSKPAVAPRLLCLNDKFPWYPFHCALDVLRSPTTGRGSNFGVVHQFDAKRL